MWRGPPRLGRSWGQWRRGCQASRRGLDARPNLPSTALTPATPPPFLLAVNLQISGCDCHTAIHRLASTTAFAIALRYIHTVLGPITSIINLGHHYNQTTKIRGECGKFSYNHPEANQYIYIYIYQFWLLVAIPGGLTDLMPDPSNEMASYTSPYLVIPMAPDYF